MKNALSTLAAGLCIVLSSCGGGGSSPSGSAEFAALELPAGAVSGSATALSGDGAIVGGTVEGGGGQRAVLWSAGGVQELGVLPEGTRSSVAGMSRDGSVVVGTSDNHQATMGVPFRWTAAGGMQALPLVQGALFCAASDVSADGAIVVGNCLGAGSFGFRWTEATGTLGIGRLGTGTSGASYAIGISPDGSRIVGAGQPGLVGAVVWSADSTHTVLGMLPGDRDADAAAASQDGRIVAGASLSASDVSTLFLWTGGALQALPHSGRTARGDHAAALSADGSVLVGWALGQEGVDDQAILWTERQGTVPLLQLLRSDYGLDLAGWALLRATSVSEDGRVIAGMGRNPQGQVVPWKVRLSARPA